MSPLFYILTILFLFTSNIFALYCIPIGSCANNFNSIQSVVQSNCTVISSLTLSNIAETNLNAIVNLRCINFLNINNNKDLILISLPNINYINNLLINNNDKLQQVYFPSIEGLSNGTVSHNFNLINIKINGTTPKSKFTGDFFTIFNNSNLQSVDLSYINSNMGTDVCIINNKKLDGCSLSIPLYLNSFINIQCNKILATILTSSLTSVIGIKLQDNDYLNYINLNNVLFSAGYFTIKNNLVLQNTKFLSSIASTATNGIIIVDGNPNLISVAGLTSTELLNLTIINNLKLINLQGLLVQTATNVIIQNNAGLKSLRGLQYLTRILGQLTISGNTNLQDFTALSSLVVLGKQPAIVTDQCCPAYDFFNEPYLFTRQNFPCQICTNFNKIVPEFGPMSGNTIVDLQFTGDSQAPWLLFYFGQSGNIPTTDSSRIVNCSLSSKTSSNNENINSYQCAVPAPAVVTSSEQVVTIQVSFDIGITWDNSELTFKYIPWNQLTSAVNGAVESSNNQATIITRVDPLTDVPSSNRNAADDAQKITIYTGIGLSAAVVFGIYLFYVCCHPKDFATTLAKWDWLRLKEKNLEEPIGDGVAVKIRTTLLGGILTIVAIVLSTTLVIALISYNLIDTQSIQVNLSPSKSRTIAKNHFQNDVVIFNLNGQCTVNDTITNNINMCSLKLNLKATGFSSLGQSMTCQYQPVPNAIYGNCLIH